LLKEGPLTSEALAKKANLNKRQLQEWLYSQTGYGILEIQDVASNTEEYLYSLKKEWEPVLFLHPNETPTEFYAVGYVDVVMGYFLKKDSIMKSMQTGVGIPYDIGGRRTAEGEKKFLIYSNAVLVPRVLQQIGWEEKLSKGGAKWGDVGCGSGVLMLQMAKKYPHSSFCGFDVSKEGLASFAEKLKEENLTNVHICNVLEGKPLPEDQSFDFITLIDVLHDLSDPVSVLRAVRASLKPDGKLLTMDPFSKNSFKENLQASGIPNAGLEYAISLFSCLQCSTSGENVKAGIGFKGLNEKLVEEFRQQSNFAKIELIDSGVDLAFRLWSLQ